MSRLYEWDIFGKRKLSEIDWSPSTFWNNARPQPEHSDSTWEALDVLNTAQGGAVIALVRAHLKSLVVAWDDLLCELIKSGNLSRWWPLAERILAQRRLDLNRLLALSFSHLWNDDPDDPFRPVAIVPAIVALRHNPEFLKRDIIDAALENERLKTRADLELIESDLAAATEALTLDSVFRLSDGGMGCLPYLSSLFDRRNRSSHYLSLLEKASGGPEAAVGEMVAAVIDDAGGYEAVADFLEGSRNHPAAVQRAAVEQQIAGLDGEIRTIDMYLDRLSRQEPGRTEGDEPAQTSELLQKVLNQAALRQQKHRELHDLRGELATCEVRRVKRDPVEKLLEAALGGDESARAELERFGSSVLYPESPEFVRAIGMARWDVIAESAARHLAAASRTEAGVVNKSPDEDVMPAVREDDSLQNDRDGEQFTLPCALADIPAPGDVTPWIARFLGRGPDEIVGILKQDWSGITSSALARVRDIILLYQPVALARREGRWYLGLHRKPDEHYEDTIYIESPDDPNSVKTILDWYGFAERDLMSEFYRHFYGLTNGVGYPSSRFARPGQFETIEEYGWDEIIEKYDPARQWGPAPIVYQTDTGDQVLLKANGESAWGLMAENRITPFAPTFEVLLEQLVESYEHYFRLDYYQWVEKWRPHG